MDDYIIKIEKLNKSFNGKDFILQDLDINIKKGSYIQILGKSGSGKSTFLNTIGLLDNDYSGNIIIDNINITKQPDSIISSIRNKHIGFIFQAYNLISNMTAMENINLPIIYSNISYDKKYKQYISSLIEKFEISSLKNKKIQFLSGGEKQRVAIVRALSLKPDIILADEPTGNLDKFTAQLIFDSLQELHRNGKTIILVTHNSTTDIGSDIKYELSGGKLNVC